jgi:hypothetical protein
MVSGQVNLSELQAEPDSVDVMIKIGRRLKGIII